MIDATADLLRELVAEVRGMRADLAGRQGRRLSQPDRAALTTLLPIIADTVGRRCFSVAELQEHAQTIPTADALRSALAAIGNARCIGKLLRRAINVDVGGLLVRRVGDDSAGATWVCIPTETLDTHRAQ